MMRILVNQTTRMGDMIQTSPLIHQLHAQYPEAHITAMVRRMGRTIAEHHPDVNDVLVYDEDELFLDLTAQDSDRLLRVYELAEKRVQQLREGRFDIAYNMTHSIASAMLLKLAGIPKVVGAHLSDDWQFLLRGPWPTYFFTSVYSREYNDLNLCDITRQFAEDAPPCKRLCLELRPAERDFVSTLFLEHGIGAGAFVACLQLGASEENKRWSAVRFAELAKLLAERHRAHVFLLGVQEEARLGEAFERFAPGLAVPLYGKTNVPQAAAVLERANVLVTNDTGTMHLAAAVNCPTVLVSVGHVHYRETGPYGEGHVAVEWRRQYLGRSDFVPGGLEEREQIQAAHVLAAVELVLEKDRGPLPSIPESDAFQQVDLLMTRFAPDDCLQFYPVIRRVLTQRDYTRMAYRAMWLHHLRERHDKRAEEESLTQLLGCYDGPAHDVVALWRDELGTGFADLAALAREGIEATEKLLRLLQSGQSMAKAKEVVAGLMRLDEQCRLHGELYPACRPLILMARFERDNLEGADPLFLAETTLNIYRACFARARLMEKKLGVVADLWQKQWQERGGRVLEYKR
ncbi:MAG: glycosyltransferase family 9 protein [Candidatus Hydrogenedentes bacterium]|nr:glycosyltransferase family 9 protein [Candidatus Hydrogenedentota bacterium]